MLGLLQGSAAIVAAAALASCHTAGPSREAAAIDAGDLHRVATVDERYQSYNIEMLEVTGGRFWKPYSAISSSDAPKGAAAESSGGGATPAGMSPDLYQYRPPIDLSNARLRKLASALGPAYVRVSGTWANTSYFADTDLVPASAPTGFNGVLTRQQWKSVVEFARSSNASIVTSFANSPGTRDWTGAWTTTLARRFADYTQTIGGSIAAAEFMNEPNAAAMGGAPQGYDARDYGRDMRIFHAFARTALPRMLILGPGSVGETTGDWGVSYGAAGVLQTRDLLAASGVELDAFSYHHYGAVSQRCAAMGNQTTVQAALSEDWLSRTDGTLAFYRRLRDQFAPGTVFWVTETADSACGGNPWASTFVDTFRYLDQLGRLASQDVRVVMHNTLASSDYGLLDENDFAPRPNYWAALLWRELMGTTVLDSGIPIQQGLHVYAHCLRETKGGVVLLVINNDRTRSSHVALAGARMRYTLSAADLQTKTVLLNGVPLALGDDDRLPALMPTREEARDATFASATITFLAMPDAGNPECR